MTRNSMRFKKSLKRRKSYQRKNKIQILWRKIIQDLLKIFLIIKYLSPMILFNLSSVFLYPLHRAYDLVINWDNNLLHKNLNRLQSDYILK